MRRFQTAETIFALVQLIGWAVVAGAAILTVTGWNQRGFDVATLLITGPILLGGLIVVALAQIGEAMIVTAVAAQESRAELSGLRADLSRARTAPAGAIGAPEGDLVETYRGVRISRGPDGFRAEGWTFADVMAARAHIDASRRI